MSRTNIENSEVIPLNSYTLVAKLRKVRRGFYLSATEQALYHELVAICNENGWPEFFKCSNAELYNALNITEKTMIGARNKLIEAGMVSFISGKSKRDFSTYSLSSTVNITANATVNNPNTVGMVVNITANQGVNSTDLYKHKQNETLNIYDESKKFDFRKSLIDYGISKELVDEWMLIRKAKKAINTQTALNKIISEVKKTGKPPDEVFQIIIDKQWKGFEAEWLEPPKQKPQKGNLLQFQSKF